MKLADNRRIEIMVQSVGVCKVTMLKKKNKINERLKKMLE